MKEIISLCVRRPITIIMLIIAVFMGAIYSLRLLPLDRLPEIIYPRVTVETAYPGMGAAEVRSAVTIPLEDSLSAVKGLEGLRSVSRDGTSLLLLSFRWGTSPVRAAAAVREAIDTVYPGLPHGVSKPTVISADLSDEPHAIVAVRSLTGDNSFAANLAEYELRARLRRIDGAGRVSVSGGVKEEIKVRADPERLAGRSLNGNDLARMIAYETADFPAGSAREGDKELTVVSAGRPRSLEELASLIISDNNGPLKLAELAGTGREKSRRQSIFIFQNMEQTALEIYRRPGADPIRLSKDIKKVIDECSFFSRDAEISLVFDSSPSILRGIRDLGVSGGFAALAVILLLALFLGRLNYSILAALSLPLSASAALIALALAGRSINSMSLGGLALGIGLVSDTSVIVLDLFCRRFGSLKKAPSADEAGAETASVSLSSMAGALTTMVVFVPVIFLPGPLGALFGDLAITLIVSVAAGWLYAQFCLPSLFCFFMDHGFSMPDPKANKFLKVTRKLEKTYVSFLKKTLRRPVPIIFISAVASLIGLTLLGFRPVEFITPDIVTEIEVAVDFPNGTPPEKALDAGIRLSQIFSELPGISSLYGRLGSEADDPGRRSDPGYRKERLLFRCFLEKPQKAADVLELVRAAVKEMDEAGMVSSDMISAGYPADRSAAIMGLSPALSLAVKGSSPEESSARAEALALTFRRDAGLALDSLRLRPSGTRPQLRLVPHRELTASLGISVSEIAACVSAASEGFITGNMEIEGRPLDIRVSLEIPGSDPMVLKNLPLTVSLQNEQQNSGPVFLGSLVDIEWIEAEAALTRQDRSDVIYLDLFAAAGKEKQINKLISGKNERGFERADESVFARYRAALVSTVILVLLLLYLTLGAQFESFLLPLIFMLSVPFSLAGVGSALFLSGSFLDSGAVLGLVTLFGLSVNNGIIFYEISEEKIRCGFSPVRAVFLGALLRFRPVLLTTLTTVFTLLPLVISPLGNSQRGMASTMLGGIIVSGLLAFFAIPPVFIRYFKSRKTGGSHD